MVENRTGCSWSKKEDKQLKLLFSQHCSFQEMAEKLGRTWFACKCRLIRLGLIEGSLKNPKYGDSPFEPFKVPNPPKFASSLGSLLESLQELEWPDEEEDTSNTFSTAELNIVIDYLKTQISRIVLSELDSENFIRQTELKTAKDLFTNEIKKVQSLKKMTVKDRQKVCKRI